MKENLSIQKTDDTSYSSLLTLIRHQEQTKRRASNPNGGKAQNAMALLQESDLRYLIDVVWNRKSVISGVRNVDQLILTRWDPKQELSPWNCILMTKSEAATHDCQLDPDALYSVEFRQRIFQKHVSSRQHFGQLPQMAEYLAENYREEQNGKMINIAVNA
jgi:IQ and ubiquitin-like domain-containing protein